jgi:hypothetical protein
VNGLRIAALMAALPLLGMLIAALLSGWTLSVTSLLLSALAMPALVLVIVSSLVLRDRLRTNIPLIAFGDGEELQLSASTLAADIIRLAGTPTEQWDDEVLMCLSYSASLGDIRFYCESAQNGRTWRLHYVELDLAATRAAGLDQGNRPLSELNHGKS